MNLLDKIKAFFRKTKRLESGSEERNTEENNNNVVNNDFKEELTNIQKSPEQIAQEEKELAQKAAYRCLAEKAVGIRKPFNRMDHLGESMYKNRYRLQAEEDYRDFGHGADIPVSDEIIQVFKIISDNIQQLKNGGESKLSSIFNEKINLNTIEEMLINNGEQVSNKTIEAFKSNDAAKKGYVSFNSFNLDSEERMATDVMNNCITSTFKEIMQEREIDSL